MSKVQEKSSMSKSGFFDEMWKIIRQNDDLRRFLNNFCNFGVLLAENKKIPTNDRFERVKIEKDFFCKFF